MSTLTTIPRPEILSTSTNSIEFPLTPVEGNLLSQAGRLLDDGYPDHALLDLWNAGIKNLQRRIETYGVDLFLSAVNDEAGRKKYKPDGDSLSERWDEVDVILLIMGAKTLGLINRKAAKCLETINWMRNHASAAHASDDSVETEDVIAFALLLQNNLFSVAIPDPGHSISALFEPIKNGTLSDEDFLLLGDQAKSLSPQELRTFFGFLLDKICGSSPSAAANAARLFPIAWERGTEDQRSLAGLRYNKMAFNIGSKSKDNRFPSGADSRLLDVLVNVKGIIYIPDGMRAKLFRRAALKLAEAKDRPYGWKDEEVAASTLAQFGPCVPKIAFDEVYQEILAVWCGNYWGRSSAHVVLKPFLEEVSPDNLRNIVFLFSSNQRVQNELYNTTPKRLAIDLLKSIEEKFVLKTHKEEALKAIEIIEAL
ncbi:hypothetical protein FRC96_12945 [Lujinxingia vulgaris]|uniref:Uncharacterized protein n=1 Tax=Lujinxingia vulgaris TaxID=2600176 RepID=A0A5C6X613_9DELT|nr:hypothetical protein [Lujinxingia vulgaris]TXD34524.1 hypothetical protein FRC96_12945 [Lujinxingia vulgaris]